MARQLRAPSRSRARPRGLRGELVAALQAQLDRLPATSEFYDFGPQRRQRTDRIAALEADADVQLHLYELPDAALAAVGVPSRFDRDAPKLWRLSGDGLEPTEPGRD